MSRHRHGQSFARRLCAALVETGVDGIRGRDRAFAGLDQLSDTALLDAIEGRYDALVTLDRNLTYQQKIEGRSVAVIVLHVVEQTPEAFQALMPQLQAAIRSASGGSVTVVGSPT